jgi:hypothetical protein
LDLLKPQVEAAGACVLRSSALGEAVTHTLALWPKLTRFLDNPEVELSNNLAEHLRQCPCRAWPTSVQQVARLTPTAWALSG